MSSIVGFYYTIYGKNVTMHPKKRSILSYFPAEHLNYSLLIKFFSRHYYIENSEQIFL